MIWRCKGNLDQVETLRIETLRVEFLRYLDNLFFYEVTQSRTSRLCDLTSIVDFSFRVSTNP